MIRIFTVLITCVLEFNLNISGVEFKYTCDQNFYSSGSAHCDVYCKVEDGSHFECSPDGEKKCSDGWSDKSSNCKIRKVHDL